MILVFIYDIKPKLLRSNSLIKISLSMVHELNVFSALLEESGYHA